MTLLELEAPRALHGDFKLSASVKLKGRFGRRFSQSGVAPRPPQAPDAVAALPFNLDEGRLLIFVCPWSNPILFG